MQGIPNNLPLDVYPPYVLQETDTATPRTPIPIYYMHDGDTPFCNSPSCICQRGKHAVAALFNEMRKGTVQLAQVTEKTTLTVSFIAGIPQDCQLYGHSWQPTEHPDRKECSLCHIRGYCPGCTPIAPAGAKPFTCTRHAQRQVY
jgi:hypothetical protein